MARKIGGLTVLLSKLVKHYHVIEIYNQSRFFAKFG